MKFYERAWIENNSINLSQDAFDLMASNYFTNKEKNQLMAYVFRLTSAYKIPVYIVRAIRSRLYRFGKRV